MIKTHNLLLIKEIIIYHTIYDIYRYILRLLSVDISIKLDPFLKVLNKYMIDSSGLRTYGSITLFDRQVSERVIQINLYKEGICSYYSHGSIPHFIKRFGVDFDYIAANKSLFIKLGYDLQIIYD